MNDNKTVSSASLDINETIDGLPMQGNATKHRKVQTKENEPTKRKADPYLWGIYAVLVTVSIIELYSASSSEVTSDSLYRPLISHVKFLILGLGVMCLFQKLHYRVFRKWAWVAAVVCAGLVVISNYTGVVINGAQRAIALPGGFTIQPPEMAKLAVVLVLARIMAKHQKSGGVTTRGIVQSAIVVAVYAGLLWKNGLTNTLILMAVSISMFIIGGIEWKKLLMVLAVYGMAASFIYTYNNSKPETDEFEQVGATENIIAGESEINRTEYNTDRSELRVGRIESYLKGVSPDDPLTDNNRQVVFSNIAQAHGGLTGNGPGSSRESARLPLAFSDYIYSIIIEDIGFVGGVILLVIYMLIPLRSGAIAGRCSRAFPALLIMGCSVLIVLQALVHMAITTGLVPVSGQPLPFISKGGTSIIIMSAALGMMLSVSRYAVRNGNRKDINKELQSLPDDIKSANPMQFESSKSSK